MISVKEIFDTVQSLALKQGHGTIAISEFDRFASIASKSLYNQKMGFDSDDYKLGKVLAKSGPGMNKEIDKSLSVFLQPDVEINLANGEGPWPESLGFVDLITTPEGVEVTWKPKHLIPSYIKSTIDSPTADNPIYTDRGTGVKVYPALPKVLVTYYKIPTDVKYGYTINGAGRAAYSASASVNFEWPEGNRMELITRILSLIGISIRDTELFQISEAQKNTLA